MSVQLGDSSDRRPSSSEICPTYTLEDYDRRYLISGLGQEGKGPEVFFESNVSLTRAANPLLSMLLPIAMEQRTDLRLPESIDPVALKNVKLAQSVLSKWYPDLARVAIAAGTGGPSLNESGNGLACFFSGGVDSFYSVLSIPQITHLIFVSGFDIDVDDTALIDTALQPVRHAAEELGKTLVEVRTNLRRFSNDRSDWGTRYHGAALATVAHLLTRHIDRVVIPASFTTAQLFPWGSHPDLDPLWSSSSLSVLHHGCDTSRTDKIAALTDSPIAMRYLRVCWENRNGSYNCGKCEKCLRTMVSLEAAGGLLRCATLPDKVSTFRLLAAHGGQAATVFARENLAMIVERESRARSLIIGLRTLIALEPFWRFIQMIKRPLRALRRRLR